MSSGGLWNEPSESNDGAAASICGSGIHAVGRWEMSMNIYMPVQEVVSLLDKEGLPAELIGSMKVGRYGGEMRTALYDLDDVRQFI